MKPRVSVIVAARNAADTIADQVSAILDQGNGGPDHLVVVDDASTDDTAHRATLASGGDPRLHVVATKGRIGAAGARTLGVTHTTGDLLVFCDADDLVARGWLTALIAAASHSHLVGGYCDDRTLNAPRQRRWRPPQPVDGLPTTARAVPYALGANLAIWRRVYCELGGWDASLAHGTDLDLCLRAHANGYRLGWEPRAVVHYRHRETRRSLMTQAYRWGRADALLLRRHRSYLANVTGPGRIGPALTRVVAREDSPLRLASFTAGRITGCLR